MHRSRKGMLLPAELRGYVLPVRRACATPASIDAVEVLRLCREEKLGPAAIARRLGIGRASVYRVLGKQALTVRANGSVDADQT